MVLTHPAILAKGKRGVLVTGLEAGTHELTYSSLSTGKQMKKATAEARGGTLAIEIPKFKGELGVRAVGLQKVE